MPGYWDVHDEFDTVDAQEEFGVSIPPAEPDGAASASLDRRTLLIWASGASLGATGFFLLATGIQALLPPGRSIDGLTEVGDVSVARLSDLKVGVPLLTEYGDHHVFVVRTSGTTVSAFDAACPHARCTLRFNASARRFDCPCHGSTFALDGRRLTGPARRGMTKAHARLIADEIIVSGFET